MIVNNRQRAELRDEFDRLRVVDTPVCAERMWYRVFTAEDRASLGGRLGAAFRQGRSTGMWIRLRGGTHERAMVEVGVSLDLVSTTTANWMLRSIGEPELVQSSGSPSSVPQWHRDARELRFRGEVIRRVARPKQAIWVCVILDAFEEAGWPDRIDSPLPSGIDPARLGKAIDSANTGLSGIRFHGDGTGCGVIWRPI